MKLKCLSLVFFILLLGCKTVEKEEVIEKDEVVSIDTLQGASLLGKPLIRRQVDPSKDSLQIANYYSALNDYKKDSLNADNLIWLGRRIAYLGDYKRAIDVFSKGISKHPEDARFYRHRGHRYISIRQFDLAISDFLKAAELIESQENEVEPDGIPNKFNTPVSTLHGNIWYHLGLAYYLKNDMPNALEAYTKCLNTSNNHDNVVSSSHWLYMILRRMNRVDEANKILEPINSNMKIIENFAYHELLLFYKGELTESDLLKEENGSIGANEATQYGIANWHSYNGNEDKALSGFKSILDHGNWAGFGYIAVESDLHRISSPID
jgi:tetratricopeptide (TPR) repeat protein